MSHPDTRPASGKMTQLIHAGISAAPTIKRTSLNARRRCANAARANTPDHHILHNHRGFIVASVLLSILFTRPSKPPSVSHDNSGPFGFDLRLRPDTSRTTLWSSHGSAHDTSRSTPQVPAPATAIGGPRGATSLPAAACLSPSGNGRQAAHRLRQPGQHECVTPDSSTIFRFVIGWNVRESIPSIQHWKELHLFKRHMFSQVVEEI